MSPSIFCGREVVVVVLLVGGGVVVEVDVDGGVGDCFPFFCLGVVVDTAAAAEAATLGPSCNAVALRKFSRNISVIRLSFCSLTSPPRNDCCCGCPPCPR